jgi:peptidoglycan hydrolase-like protein with peptidoglycan-binding domain
MALLQDGEFPATVPFNQNFGPNTLKAVQKFQVKYGIASPGMIGYGRCGPKTRLKLNELFN